MMNLCVVLNGQVINVGPWDAEVAGPMPEGAQEGEFDIEQTADGRIVLVSDYRALRAAAYPAIGDQLDALFKAGLFPADMAARLTAVKATYLKPAAPEAG